MKITACARVALLVCWLLSSVATHLLAGETDPNTIWPLCGRISENPPAGWNTTDGCPASRFGDPAFSDEPLSSTFGPRPLASESNRYDFHRGVDIATPVGTPFFAITDGIVEIAGVNSSYSDPLVKLRHFRPGESSCNAGGCYHSFYLHISNWVVSADDVVVKGQLLGYTGASGSGFEHLHFEVRDAPGFDPYSAWQRDSIHPLRVVPYLVPNNTAIQFNTVDFTDPLAGRVDLTLTSNRYDLVHVGLTLLDSNQQIISQSGNIPDAFGYYVQPPFFDMELWNFQYTHKDSSSVPWESFGAGGVNQCPYFGDHGLSYDAHVHMDGQDPVDYHEGLFNGLHIRTGKYWPSNISDYRVDLDFQALDGAAACVQVDVLFASGDTSFADWGDCSGSVNQSPTAGFSSSCVDLDCSFTDTSSDTDGTIVSWAWDFGDGNTSSTRNPDHSYAAAGSYILSLTVTDDGGATDSASISITVNAPSPQEPLDQFASNSTTPEGTASGSYSATQADDGVSQSITESTSGGSPQRQRTSLEHQWEISVTPGTLMSFHVNAWISGPADADDYVFSYSTDGSFYIDLLTVSSTDSDNLQSAALPANLSGTLYIRVEDSNNEKGDNVQGEISVDQLYIRTAFQPQPNMLPEADFTWGCSGQVCSFIDRSMDLDGALVSWAWNFGDGNVSNVQNPVNSFPAAGNYSVSLMVTDDEGASDSFSDIVSVAEATALAITSITPSVLAAGSAITVTVDGSGFAAGATLSFYGGSGPSPAVSNLVFLDPTSLTATVSVGSGGPNRERQWDVVVTNPNGDSALLPGGLTVTP